eukprot:473679-Lingulodinium_polyedra.AAC.1
MEGRPTRSHSACASSKACATRRPATMLLSPMRGLPRKTPATRHQIFSGSWPWAMLWTPWVCEPR